MMATDHTDHSPIQNADAGCILAADCTAADSWHWMDPIEIHYAAGHSNQRAFPNLILEYNGSGSPMFQLMYVKTKHIGQ